MADENLLPFPEFRKRTWISKPAPESGTMFGFMEFVEELPERNEKGRRLWRMKCRKCGAIVVKRREIIVAGHAATCSIACAKTKENAVYLTQEYGVWEAMNQRCNNPNTKHYHCYGGRGITICERWKSFENFLADMGPRPTPEHTIDRIDNNGNYEPSNCRWATRKVQQRNRRTCHMVSINGESKTIVEWCEKFAISPKAVSHRLKVGWDAEKAISTPIGEGEYSKRKILRLERDRDELPRLQELEHLIVRQFPVEEFHDADDKGARELFQMLLDDWKRLKFQMDLRGPTC